MLALQSYAKLFLFLCFTSKPSSGKLQRTLNLMEQTRDIPAFPKIVQEKTRLKGLTLFDFVLCCLQTRDAFLGQVDIPINSSYVQVGY